MSVPCGQCIGCRLERSRQWAIRCLHEASQHEQNSFITLTYNAEHLPSDQSLNKKHFQDFMKRLRFHFAPQKVRFFHCGEYGSKLSRPHYHACLFGLDFDDKYLHQVKRDVPLYRSATLEKLWPFGFSTVGSVTFASAAYVARYIMKKVTGELAHDHYLRVDSSTGEMITLQPEYTTMSRKPGVGRKWFDKYKKDVYPDDFVVIKGRKMRPPAYYDKIYQIDDEPAYDKLKIKRAKAGKRNAKDATPSRLATRETIKKAQTKNLSRDLEDN